MSAENRKITFHALRVIENSSDSRREPSLIRECLAEIIKCDADIKKIEDKSVNRIHYLHFYKTTSNYGIGFFVSAKHHHCPPLVNCETLDTRSNPKKLQEGEMEMTHFAIGFTEEEALFLLEKKHGGVACGTVTRYLNNYLKKIKYIKKFSIVSDDFVQGTFLSKLNEMQRVKIAELYYTSDLLSETFKGDIPISSEMKNEVVLTLKAQKRLSIKNMIKPAYNLFTNNENKKVSRLRIYGTSDEGASVLLDTDRIIEANYIKADLDNNGQVLTESFLSKMEEMMRKLIGT